MRITAWCMQNIETQWSTQRLTVFPEEEMCKLVTLKFRQNFDILATIFHTMSKILEISSIEERNFFTITL